MIFFPWDDKTQLFHKHSNVYWDSKLLTANTFESEPMPAPWQLAAVIPSCLLGQN